MYFLLLNKTSKASIIERKVCTQNLRYFFLQIWPSSDPIIHYYLHINMLGRDSFHFTLAKTINSQSTLSPEKNICTCVLLYRSGYVVAYLVV